MPGGSNLRTLLEHCEGGLMERLQTVNVTVPTPSWSQPVGKGTEAFEYIWQFRVGLFGVAGTAVCVFGVVGNLISILVLSRFPRTSSNPFLLICLEIFDTLVLLSELFLETLPILGKASMISPEYNPALQPVYAILYPVSHISQIGTTYMTVLVTCERFIAVAKPLLVSRLCRHSAAYKAVAAVTAFALVFNIPLYLAYTSGDKWDVETNSTKFSFERTEFGKSRFYNSYYLVWINFSLAFLIPFVTVAVLNCLVIRALRRSNSFQPTSPNAGQHSHAHRKHEYRLTAMMFALTSVFFVTEFCQASALILIRDLDNYSQCSVACNNFTTWADFMVLLNSAIHVVLYCAVGERFRQIFMALFICRKMAGDVSNASSSVAHRQSRGGSRK